MATNRDERKLAKLISKRETLFRRVQLLYDVSKSLDSDLTNADNIKRFQIRINALPQTVSEYKQTVEEIIDVEQDIDPETPPNYATLEAFQELCDYINYIAGKIKTVESSTSNAESRIRLPKIDLLKFNGDDLSLWPLFYENFKNLVHLKPFNNVEKLQYLLGSLQGKALKSISSVEPLPENYEIIWKILEDNYQDSNYLAASYIDKLLNFRLSSNNKSNQLQIFLEQFDTNVSALKRLKLDDLSDYIFTHIAKSKLPSEIHNAFELIRDKDKIPTYDELIRFIKQQSKYMTQQQPEKVKYISNSSETRKPFKTFVTNNDPQPRRCIACNGPFHLLIECKYFKECNPEQRFKIIKENKLCINCFSQKHKVQSCTSKFSCTVCRLKHHTLLHRNISQEKPNLVSSSPGNSTVIQDTHQAICNTLCLPAQPIVVLLSTAIVNVIDKWNRMKSIRVLIDNGSMSNILTEKCCKILGLSISKQPSKIYGIGGTFQTSKGKASLVVFSSVNSKVKYSLEALVVEKITSQLPENLIDPQALSHLNNLPLADPTYSCPGEIHGILGAQIFSQIIGTRHVTGSVNTPTALETTLGYIVMGTAPALQNSVTALQYNSAFVALENISQFVNVGSIKHVPKKEEAICEKIYSETVTRDQSGRYAVALPFKYDPTKLGNSFDIARNRFLSLERRLHKSPELRVTYSAILQDYLEQGHMSLVPEHELQVPSYYIPHHCVLKQNSVSTPCRIVFDASMKTENGISLNDILYTGPKLQNDIIAILLNFRLFSIAITADIRQMYRQINVLECHRPFQRILWRFDTNDPILVYQLNTVTFGVKSSPYLSLRTIKQLTHDEAHIYPQAVNLIKRNLYVDDLICSLPDLDTATDSHFQLVKLLLTGGFKMVKWMSNSSEFLSQIPSDYKLPQNLEFDQGNNSYVLGLLWNHSTDLFTFKIELEQLDCTKRNMLSVVARIFDPLSFLAPVTLFIKLLIKRLWELKLEWDEPAPKNISELWINFQKELVLLNNVCIPRHLGLLSESVLTLVGFCDASPAAYGCVIFCRVEIPNHEPKISLLIAKSKVAPVKITTLPRLELTAAVLLAKQLAYLKTTYGDRIFKIYALSDSMITLCWINSDPCKWKPFVSHRVSQIHQLIPNIQWYFVPGKENAADCASRSLTPSQLLKNSSWFNGPPWLRTDFYNWPIKSTSECKSQNMFNESRVHIAIQESHHDLYPLINYFSSWSKLLNATVYVLRFIKVLPRNGNISNRDWKVAEEYLLRTVQKNHFFEDYRSLETLNCPVQPALRKLNPFVFNKIIRVGGRLAHANIKIDQKHPVLLPKSDPLVVLLINYYHKKYCHAGPHLLQSLLCKDYWILSARSVIRQCIWKCNTCFRTNPKPIYPLMGDLPAERVNPAKAFLNTGIDYTGAFFITMSRRRGIKSQKAYVCLFICLATKAIHLELASDLSTEAFLAAFKRFISRRGTCTCIYSDCGTNFVGAKTKLNELHELIESKQFKDSLQHELNSCKITWKFNPPSSPWMGGFWEANIKSLKTHLTRVVGTQILTYEEFYTVLTQIEAVLNSRPLYALSDDPNAPVALTPSHFLYGSPLNSLPAEDLTSEPPNRLVERYKLLDSMVQHFWKRWHVEYLSTLQCRQKWNTKSNPPKEGNVVVIIRDDVPPLLWPLATIQRLYPGKDGVSRVALVKTKNSSYMRPVAKLCPLPNQ